MFRQRSLHDGERSLLVLPKRKWVWIVSVSRAMSSQISAYVYVCFLNLGTLHVKRQETILLHHVSTTYVPPRKCAEWMAALPSVLMTSEQVCLFCFTIHWSCFLSSRIEMHFWQLCTALETRILKIITFLISNVFTAFRRNDDVLAKCRKTSRMQWC